MPQSPPRDPQFQWAELTDFSPGIYSNNNLGGGTNVTSTNLAMAQTADTWGCRSLPTGGLGPLPRRKFSLTLATPPNGATVTTYQICGMNTWGFLLSTPLAVNSDYRDEVHMVLTYATAGGGGTNDNHAVWLRERLYDLPSPTTETIATDTDTGAADAVGYLYAHLLKTRMLPATPDLAGVPVMVCVWSSDDQQLHINQVFPDPASPALTGTIDLGTAAAVYRHAVGHQGRVVVGEYHAYQHGVTTFISTDENIEWTETNSNVLVTTDFAAFVPEVDQTITDWCSMSANQLVVIKRIGGGYVLQGDLSDVTVVRLPNLKSSDGTAVVKGTNTPIGFIYSAGDSGLYLWNGGDASEPISNQLDGQTFTDITGVDRSGLVGQIERWGDLVVAPNGWVMDLETRNWWRLESEDQPDALDNPIVHWSATSYQGQIIGSPQHFTTGEDCIHIYEMSDLAYTYSWRSQPLWASQDRVIQVREAIVAIEGLGTVTLTVIDEDGNTSSHTFTSITTEVRNYRCNLSLSAENLQVLITASGEGADDGDDIQAPMVHRCYIGFTQKQHLPLSSQ